MDAMQPAQAAVAALFGGDTEAALRALQGLEKLDDAVRRTALAELAFWRERHPAAVTNAAAQAFAAALQTPHSANIAV